MVQLFLYTKLNTPFPGFLDAFSLPFCPNFCLKLRNCAQHIEEQASCSAVGVNILVQHLQGNLFALQFCGNLAKMQRRTSQTV